MTSTATTYNVTRPILQNRTFNPYSRAGQIRNRVTTNPRQIYEDLDTRIKTGNANDIANAVAKLKTRTGNQTFNETHFGYVEKAKLSDLDVNIDNQRDIEWPHVLKIIESFDSRITQTINAIKLPNGRYSIPEGQHTAVALRILQQHGVIANDFQVELRVIDHDLKVPGSVLTGEAFGNLLFRIINTVGRKAIAHYYIFRSRVNGVVHYGSTLQEDVHAAKIQDVLDANNMFAAPAHLARGHGATPGMVTYITGLLDIAEHDTANFDDAIDDLDWCLRMHNQYFYREKGVDGGFILAMGRYAKMAREQNITITADHEMDIMTFFKHRYGSPKMFHDECKTRLKNFQKINTLPETWTDACLTPAIIMDFDAWCKTQGKQYPIVNDLRTKTFYGM